MPGEDPSEPANLACCFLALDVVPSVVLDRSLAAPSRYWRTRPDPFADVWAEVKEWLVADPDLTAKALLARLQQEHSCSFSAGQLRTLQRRVREWRQEMARRLIFSTDAYDAGAHPLIL